MTTALRPMSTGELLDRTFQLYKRHFLLFVGIGVPAPAMVLLLLLLSSLGDALPGMKSPFYGTAAAVSLAVAVVTASIGLLFGFALTHAATIRAVSALHLSLPITIRQAYAELRGHYLRLVGVFLSCGIRVFGGSLILYFGSIAAGVMAAGAASLMGTFGVVIGVVLAIAAFVGGLLLALTLFVRYSLAVQACVVEDIPGKQAIKRSVFLARGSRNRILTVYVLFSVISSALWGCLALLASLCELFIHSPQVIAALLALAFFLTLVLTMPLVTVAMSLVYYDERVRKEAFDLQVLIAGLETPAAKAASAAG